MRKYRLKNGTIGVTKEFDNLWRLVIAEGSRTLVGFKGDFRPYLRYFPLQYIKYYFGKDALI